MTVGSTGSVKGGLGGVVLTYPKVVCPRINKTATTLISVPVGRGKEGGHVELFHNLVSAPWCRKYASRQSGEVLRKGSNKPPIDGDLPLPSVENHQIQQWKKKEQRTVLLDLLGYQPGGSESRRHRR